MLVTSKSFLFLHYYNQRTALYQAICRNNISNGVAVEHLMRVAAVESGDVNISQFPICGIVRGRGVEVEGGRQVTNYNSIPGPDRQGLVLPPPLILI